MADKPPYEELSLLQQCYVDGLTWQATDESPIATRPAQPGSPEQSAADFEEARLRLRYLVLAIGGIGQVMEALNADNHEFHYVARDCSHKPTIGKLGR